ncbi:DUF1727 domain-containing protein [Candidatus Saccharibacteria bacterium]|nr:DUF1727 domain-containing protein [Candidatus Saccharibacteria bacterium]
MLSDTIELMRSLLAILAAKTVFRINRLTGTGGTSLPGVIAQKIDRDILQKLVNNNFPRGTIVVTGTNGKTTTTKMIADILEANAVSYVHNRTGSNMEGGLIASMAMESNIAGKVSAEVGIFEVDEAFVPKICRAIKPDILLVNNLFRDQLDRYGELDRIAKNFRDLIEELDSTQLVLNADDPLVASLGYGLENKKKVTYFGIGDYTGPKLAHDRTADSIFDPFTQEKLYYTQQYFSHMGKYRGKSGAFRRPKPDYQANNLKQSGLTIEFNINNSNQPVKLNIPGIFNVYNSIAAYSAIKAALNFEDDLIIKAISGASAAFGRSEVLNYDGREVLMLLIKNPTGLNQVIQTYLLSENDRLLVFIINDNYADGRDISWLWDSALEDLSKYKGKIMVGGSRADDMALRLKYAGKKDVLSEPNEELLLKLILKHTTRRSKIFILPTYTAMLSVRGKIVASDEVLKEYWQ